MFRANLFENLSKIKCIIYHHKLLSFTKTKRLQYLILQKIPFLTITQKIFKYDTIQPYMKIYLKFKKRPWNRLWITLQDNIMLNYSIQILIHIHIVSDPPLVVLSLGSTLNPDDIKEGDDVYFECSIRANPKEHRITWYHDVSTFSYK